MAYFDSSKNRALWEIRLAELRRERAAREAGGGRNVPVREKAAENAPFRVRMTYKELLQEEISASQKNAKQKTASMERSRRKEDAKEMQREADAYELQ